MLAPYTLVTSAQLVNRHCILGVSPPDFAHIRGAMSVDMPLEPVKVFRDLTRRVAATMVHFEEYSAGVSKLLKLKVWL